MIRVLVSSCLLGERVRYSGRDARSDSPTLAAWLAEGRVVPFCPEMAGGLGVPRPTAEIRGAGGDAVLRGEALVKTEAGADVTDAFTLGARLALERARAEGVRVAILKDGSPSCGSRAIYDGSFSGRRVEGRGVTAALLEQSGIRVFPPERIEDAARLLGQMEAEGRDDDSIAVACDRG